VSYPYEKGEAERFIPSAFADMKDPPTLWLRTGTPREKRRQRRMMDEEGLRTHSDSALQAELLKGMAGLFSTDDYALWSGKVQSYWAASESFLHEHEDTEPEEVPEFVFEEEELILEVLNQIGKDWRPYRILVADNREANRTIADVFNSCVIERYENIDVPVDRMGKYITLDCAMEVGDELDQMAHKAELVDDAANPRVELNSKCIQKLFLTKEQEKNSELPQQSSPSQDNTKAGKESTNGPSKAAAPSPKTPEAA